MELQWCPYKTQIQDFNETLLGPTEAPFRMSSKRNHKSEVKLLWIKQPIKTMGLFIKWHARSYCFFLLIDDDK